MSNNAFVVFHLKGSNDSPGTLPDTINVPADRRGRLICLKNTCDIPVQASKLFNLNYPLLYILLSIIMSKNVSHQSLELNQSLGRFSL